MTGSTESGKISLVLYVDVEHGVLIETLWNVKSVLTRGANGTLLY